MPDVFWRAVDHEGEPARITGTLPQLRRVRITLPAPPPEVFGSTQLPDSTTAFLHSHRPQQSFAFDETAAVSSAAHQALSTIDILPYKMKVVTGQESEKADVAACRGECLSTTADRVSAVCQASVRSGHRAELTGGIKTGRGQEHDQ